MLCKKKLTKFIEIDFEEGNHQLMSESVESGSNWNITDENLLCTLCTLCIIKFTEKKNPTFAHNSRKHEVR